MLCGTKCKFNNICMKTQYDMRKETHPVIETDVKYDKIDSLK